MNKIISCLVLSLATVSVALAVEPSASTNGLTKAQLKERRAAAKARIIAKRGGYVRKPGVQKGAIGIVNAAGAKGDVEKMKRIGGYFADEMKIEVKVSSVEALPKKGLADEMKKLGLDAAVFVTWNEDCDLPLLYAPEQHWAVLNVRALAAAKEADEKQQSVRFGKELSRALAFICGACSSMSGEGLLGAATVDEIDTCGNEFETEVVARFGKYLAKIGVTPYYETIYREACREGWAPQPTNDFQRAIWDEFHTKPTEPMKIKYDPKKGM